MTGTHLTNIQFLLIIIQGVHGIGISEIAETI